MKKVIGICGLITLVKILRQASLKRASQRISFRCPQKTLVLIYLVGIEPQKEILQSRAFREQVDEWWAKRLDIPTLSPWYALQYIGTNVLRPLSSPHLGSGM